MKNLIFALAGLLVSASAFAPAPALAAGSNPCDNAAAATRAKSAITKFDTFYIYENERFYRLPSKVAQRAPFAPREFVVDGPDVGPCNTGNLARTAGLTTIYSPNDRVVCGINYTFKNTGGKWAFANWAHHVLNSDEFGHLGVPVCAHAKTDQ